MRLYPTLRRFGVPPLFYVLARNWHAGFELISDTDDIMLDLEEANRDAMTMQQTLSSSYADEDDFTPGELETELELMLSEDALVAQRRLGRTRSKVPEQGSPEPAQGRPPDEPPCTPMSESAGTAPSPAPAPAPAATIDMVSPVVTMYPAEPPRKKEVRDTPAESHKAAATASTEAREHAVVTHAGSTDCPVRLRPARLRAPAVHHPVRPPREQRVAARRLAEGARVHRRPRAAHRTRPRAKLDRAGRPARNTRLSKFIVLQ